VSQFNPLIRTKKYATQTGQLVTAGQPTARDRYGDLTSDTVITTVKCLVYWENDEQSQTNPAISNLVFHKLVLPFSVRTLVDLHSHIRNVTDKFGNVVLLDARIDKITDYNHWKYKPRFFVCDLDLNLDG
jgi:hypothetical protein